MHQPLVRFVKQTYGYRKPVRLRDLSSGIVQRLKVIAHCLHIGIRCRLVLRLEGQQIDERRLRPLNLR